MDQLCERFAIPRVYPDQPYVFYGRALQSFEGIIGHAMVRSDKSDPAPDPRLWQTLRDLAGLQPTPVSPAGLATEMPPPLTPGECETLFTWNTRQLNRMNVAAGSMVKTLLMELERRHVYLRLKTTTPGAHIAGYQLVQGDSDEVARLAHALGLTATTDRLLEVRHA